MPAAAAAALPRTCRDTELMPDTSTTLYIIVRSLLSTYGATSPPAMVLTRTFGTPMGSARMAWAAMAEPPLPAAASTACSLPSRYRSRTTRVTPSAIAATAAPRSPAARRSAGSCPAARATVSAGTSATGPPSGGGRTPVSTIRTSLPYSRSRSRSQAYSSPLVSSVPTRTTVAMSFTLLHVRGAADPAAGPCP